MALDYPPVGFHFSVQFEGLSNKYSEGTSDAGFQKVSGINMDISTEEYHEGGENRFKHRLPNPPVYQNLILESGMLIGSKLIQWYKDCVESFSFKPCDITVILRNGDHKPLQAWNFVNAIPLKWSISDFNAMENSIVVESVEFSYQYSKRLNVSDLTLLAK